MTTTIDHLPTLAAKEASPPAEVASPPAESGPTWEDFRTLEEHLEKRAGRREGWTLFIFLFAGIAVVFSMIAIGMGGRAIGQAKRIVRTATPAPAAAGPTPPPAPAASPGPVTLGDFTVDPAAATVAAGNVTVSISNIGRVQHELLVFRSDLAPTAYPMKDGNIDEEGAGVTLVSDGENIDPGATQTRTIDLTQPGTYLFVCNLPGHVHAGMYSVVTVK